jgi:hypothetical protein
MTESKSVDLPLVDTPKKNNIIQHHLNDNP